MEKCKTKAIQADLGIFSIFWHNQAYSDTSRHNQAYCGIIQTYFELCVTLAYSELWYIRILAYSKPEAYSEPLYPKLWHVQIQRYIQNPGLFRTLRYSEPEAYSEPCQTSMMERFEKQLTAIITFAISAVRVL